MSPKATAHFSLPCSQNKHAGLPALLLATGLVIRHARLQIKISQIKAKLVF